MLALRENFHQSLRQQTLQVNTGGGRSHVSGDRQFRASSRATVAQAVQHAGTRWLADGRRNSSGRVVMVFDIHTLIVDEVFMLDNGHTEKVHSYFAAAKPENTHDHHLHHSIRNRSLSARWIQAIRRELGTHHPSMRRTSYRIFSSA